MPATQCLPRPELTEELVERWQSDKTQEKERAAVRAVGGVMIKIFKDKRYPSYFPEACKLAAVMTDDEYRTLLEIIGNAIIEGSTDGTILPTEVLIYFRSVIQAAGQGKSRRIHFGATLNSLQRRLKQAVQQADPQKRYDLILPLSSVLDAMNDVKVTGLARLELHKPLLEELSNIRKEKAPRLAHAAGYAYQALLGIPDDESTFEAFWRVSSKIVQATAKLASAVATADPAKLLDGLTDTKVLLEVAESMIKVVKAANDLYRDTGSSIGEAKFQKQRGWYKALRYADMLVKARAFKTLDYFLEKVPCANETNFICGMCALLEEAYSYQEVSKEEIVPIVTKIFSSNTAVSKTTSVQEWIQILADTFKEPQWRTNNMPPPQPFYRTLFRGKRKKPAPEIQFRHRRDRPDQANLLSKAWKQCEEANLFYADAAVIQHYSTGDRLQIIRLSKELLPMDGCYINLVIVEQPDLPIDDHEPTSASQLASPFTLVARLNVQEPDRSIQVSLPSLFDQREWDGLFERPTHIKIQGRAGVGKTTLCKKIVYDFVHSGMWNDLFDRIFWVPLRDLRRIEGAGHDLETFFRSQYFSQDPDKACFAKALSNQVGHPHGGDRTLFLLDGLDEISEELNPESHIYTLIQHLLVQRNVVITSRPNVTHSSQINSAKAESRELKLETIGFYPDQVNEYISKACTNQAGVVDADKVNKIQAFLQGHRLIQSLVRIPIQLDALCCGWDSQSSSEPPSTMTTLYEQIEISLWKIDLQRQGKMTDEESRSSNRLWIRKKATVCEQLEILEAIAFSGLYGNIQEFTKLQRKQIYESFELPVSESLIEKTSFLRTSSTSSLQEDKHYHFIHLTFQEYFAARYVVGQWTKNAKLVCLSLGKAKAKKEEAEVSDFAKNQKYNPRYDILWRFVAGLLHAHGKAREMFNVVQAEPRDLLGPVHQRLIMHCLSEVVFPEEEEENEDDSIKLASELEAQMSLWLPFECLSRRRSNLVGEMEFPERVLNAVLQDGQEATKVVILRSLKTRPTLFPSVVRFAESLLCGASSSELKEAVLFLFQHPDAALSDETLQVVATELNNDEVKVKAAAVAVLCARSNLSDDIFQSLKDQVTTGLSDTRSKLFRTLGRQPALSERFQEFLLEVSTYGGKNDSVLAHRLLLRHRNLSPKVIDDLASQLGDLRTQGKAASVLNKQSKLSAKVVEDLVARAKDVNWKTSCTAFKALAGQSALPVILDEILAKSLGHSSTSFRIAALEVVGNQSALSETLLEKLVGALKDVDPNVRKAAIGALAKRPTLSEEQQKAVWEIWKNSETWLRPDVIRALATQSPLSQQCREELARVLVDRAEETRIRTSVIVALGRQADLSEKHCQSLANVLNDTVPGIRVAAVSALGRQSQITATHREMIMKRSGDEDASVRVAVIETVSGRGWKGPQEELLNLLVQSSTDTEKAVRVAAVGLYLLDNLGKLLPILLEANDAKFQLFYQAWLMRSFAEHRYWYFQGGKLIVGVSEKSKPVSLEGVSLDRLRIAVQEAQQSLPFPFPGAEAIARKEPEND